MASIRCSNGHENVQGNRFCYVCGELLSAVPAGVYAGMVLGDRYRVRQELGQGGFGRTYLAEDIYRFNELCVLKEFAPQAQGTSALQKAEELFQREAGILYKLQHPQIPRFRELFRADIANQGQLFLVQDYVDGQTYRQLLIQRRPEGRCFTEFEVQQLLKQMLPVLHYIHSQGVIHRDISPDNLILRYSDQLPVLIDFGGVKQVASQFSYPPQSVATVTRLGKVGYAPDEQMQQGSAFPHSDLYALGMTALVLLTGKEPIDLLVGSPQQWHSLVSQRFANVLDRMTAPLPHQRFQSATEVMQALNGIPPNYSPAVTQPPDYSATSLPYVGAVATGGTVSVHPTQPSFYPPPQPPSIRSVPASPAVMRQRRSQRWVPLLLLLLLGSGGTATWVMRDRWLPWVTATVNWAISDAPDDGSTDDGSSSLPGDEQARKAELNQRRDQLGINPDFLIKLTNSTFFERYPDQKGRTLSTEAEDAEWRAKWDAIASSWLDLFEQHLSAETRRRLGSFTNADQERWKQQVNRVYVGSRSLNDLADATFAHLFPQINGEFIDQPIGQVWQAIAADWVTALENGSALQELTFEPGTFSRQVSGTLKPGEGKVYIALLSEDQIMRVRLSANSDAVLMSIYPPRPTSAVPSLLEDSEQSVWSGRLVQTGYYEITLVSKADGAALYDLAIAVDNVTSTPVEPQDAEKPDAKD